MRNALFLALTLQLASAHAGQAMLEIDTRPGASLAALEMTGPAEVRNVVIYMVGGSGQRPLRGLDFDDLPTDPDTLFAAQRQLANQVGAVVAIDTASDHPVLEMIDRQGAAHQQDILAVIAAMRKRHPGARIILMGSSNGAYSAAVLGVKLAKEIDAVVLVNGSADAWTEATHLKQPVLGLHHRRDACLPFRDSYPRARFFKLVEVDDARMPPVGQSTPRDCGPESAHAMFGRRAQIYRAIGDWIMTGKAASKIE